MVCPKCGAELPDDSQFCNKCGAEVIYEDNIGDHTEQQHLTDNVFEDNENVINEPNSAKKHNTVRTILLIGITCFLIVGFYFLYPILKYNSARGLLSSHQYDKAITTFTQLKNYKDSPDQILNCKYQQAKEWLSNGKYEEAIEAFTKLNNYSDSETMLKEAKYNLASYYHDSKQYSESSQLFNELENYKDSKNKFRDAIYLDGKSKYSDGDIVNAKIQFKKITTYKDSALLLSQCEILEEFQGTWVSVNDKQVGIIIKGNKVVSHIIGWDDMSLGGKLVDKQIVDNNGTKYSINDKGLLVTEQKFESGNIDTDSYQHGNISINSKMYPPKVGMTAQEVKDSQWGSPEKINKTTTAYTIHEQWVYSGYRYIYLDNGIVTAIQN